MKTSKELMVQPSLSAEVFNRFINLKVALSLSGSSTYDLAELEKVLAGEQLQKGAELVVTARYFVADMHMPVSREQTYEYNSNGGGSQYKDVYRLGNAKLDLKLVKVKKIDVQQANLKQSLAKPCSCLVENVPNTKRPDGYRVAQYPLAAYWADGSCRQCHGQGYVLPRENKAPLSREIHASGVLILVDELPEAPDIPEGGCPECGMAGVNWQGGEQHHYECQTGKQREKERAAAERAAKRAAKKAAKDAGAGDSPAVTGSSGEEPEEDEAA